VPTRGRGFTVAWAIGARSEGNIGISSRIHTYQAIAAPIDSAAAIIQNHGLFMYMENPWSRGKLEPWCINTLPSKTKQRHEHKKKLEANFLGEIAVLCDRSSWPKHRPWLIGCFLAFVGSLGWFVAEGWDAVDWPGGGTIPGFTFGVAGGLIVAFEFLLWPRKKVRAWRIGSAQSWLRAHIWLGLLSLPILILHSGLRFGGWLTTCLMVLLIVVIASGVYGLILQNLIPVRRLAEIPLEGVYDQQVYLVEQMLKQADQMVSSTCGAAVETAAAGTTPAIAVGSRTALRIPAAPVRESEALLLFYRDQVGPFLRHGANHASPLANAQRAASVFQSMKGQTPPAAHGVLDALEHFCRERRRWDYEARMHFWLHNWLWVHFPLSVALIVLMIAHIFTALKYR
jgi:hypothetical protein